MIKQRIYTTVHLFLQQSGKALPLSHWILKLRLRYQNNYRENLGQGIIANQGTSRPVPLHLQPFRTRWEHGHVSEVDGIIKIAPICSTQWLSIFYLHWSWISPTASKLQISNIKYHIQACIRDASLQNSMETMCLQYILSDLSFRLDRNAFS